MKNSICLLLACLMLPPGRAANADTPPRYQLTVLPLSLDNPYRALSGGINNAGQIIGTTLAGRYDSNEGSQPNHCAVLWQNDHPLRRLDITAPPRFTDSYPVCINDKGEVAGRFYSQDSGGVTLIESEAFFWQKGQTKKISGLPGNDYSEALGLNNKGEVVGTFNNNLHAVDVPPGADVSFPHSFLYRNGQMTSFGFGVANGINDKEEIIGDDAGKGALWFKGHRTLLGMEPRAINKWGWIAGMKNVSEAKGHLHSQSISVACLWKKGRVVILGKPGSAAYALNSRGQAVGKATMPKPRRLPEQYAALWQQGRAYDLNHCVWLPKGWRLDTATGINDKGWIIGEGHADNKPNDPFPEREFTFLLMPKD